MDRDERREIFERLESLERRLGSGSENCGSWERGRHEGGPDRERRRHRHHDRHRDRGGEDFQEKRIIDTIVRLVSEQVGRIIQDQQARARARDDGGGEKRIVDLIVGLISEHVQEIVSAELDRRFGSPESRRAGDEPTTPSPATGEAGGCSEAE